MRSFLRLLTESSRLCGTVKMRTDAESLEVLLLKVSLYLYTVTIGCLRTSIDSLNINNHLAPGLKVYHDTSRHSAL